MDIVYYLYFLFAVDFFAIFLALPVYSSYIISLEGTAFLLGLINSSTALVSLIANPVIGSLSDTKGRRSLLAKCLLCNVSGNILYVIAPTWHFVYLGKIVAAFGSSVGILQKAILADVIESEEHRKAFLQKSMLIQGLMAVTVAGIAGRISEIEHGFSMIYLTIALGYCLALIIIYTQLPDDTKEMGIQENISVVTRSVEQMKSIALTLKEIDWSRYWDIFAMRAGTDLGISIFVTNIGLFLIEQYDMKGSKNGKLFMAIGAFAILANILKIRLAKSFTEINDYSLILKCAAALTLSFSAISVFPSLFIVYIGMMAFGCSKSFLEATFNEIITVKTTESDRGRVISSFENLTLIAQFVAPFLSGILSIFLSLKMLIALACIPPTITSLIAYKQMKVDVAESKSDISKKVK